MADFGSAFHYILRWEGAWSDDPLDPGGPTMYGVTLATGRRHGFATKEALRAITLDQAAAIYRASYWRFDGVLDQSVATKVFDMAVNIGLLSAVKKVQRLLNVYGADLVVDGYFGPLTTVEVNRRDPDLVMDLLCGISKEHYESVVAKRPESRKFLKGWLRRAGAVP